MSLRVVITEQAEREMQSAFNWWAEHRSKRQADRWNGGLAQSTHFRFIRGVDMGKEP